jgi:hypothetical protein
LAGCRGHAATGVALPQKSESLALYQRPGTKVPGFFVFCRSERETMKLPRCLPFQKQNGKLSAKAKHDVRRIVGKRSGLFIKNCGLTVAILSFLCYNM